MNDRLTPASYGQERLWFFDQLQPRASLYNIQHAKVLPGAVEPAAVEDVFAELIRRHEVFRTTFRGVDGTPVQVIAKPFRIAVPLVDLLARPDDARSREMSKIVDEDNLTGFDLEHGPLLRAKLIRVHPHQTVLLASIHHIVFDDWSVDVFDREFAALLADFAAGRPSSLSPPVQQYSAYADAQRARYDGGTLSPQLVYWRERLRGMPATTELPTVRPRPQAQTFPGASRTFAVPAEAALGFRQLTRAADATLFMSLFAVFAVLIQRHTGQSDVAVGTPMADRNRPELADLIGFFVNTLVLRLDLADDPSFVELLARARAMALGALAHQDMPFERLVEDLRPARDASRTPLVQLMFVYQFGRGSSAAEEPKDAVASGAKFDLTLTVIDAAPGIRGTIEYNTDLFDADTVARLADRFSTLVASAAADPERRVSTLAMLPQAERRRILEDWGGGSPVPLPRGRAFDLFADHAAARPDMPAVVSAEARLTYGELAARAGAVAAGLTARGVAPGSRVGIHLARSPDFIVALLGCMAAGSAMVPLDPALPADRLRFLVEDAALALVLTASAPAGLTIPSVAVGELGADGAGAPALPSVAGADDLAYVVYTSGSTGRPKGVAVEHSALANLALAQGRAWNVGPGSNVLQFAAPGFDAAMSEVFATLCLGGCLHVAAAEDTMPGPPLSRTLRERRITHVTLPPSALAAMPPDDLPDLGLIVSAGEALDPALARRWNRMRRVVNAYGPTEITVCATMHDLAEGAASAPIGRPLPNVAVYVLDRHGEPVPPGVPGEIHVGGIGVARGYLNRPELTAERFVPDPFSGRPGARLYRTGDLGRFDPHGVLHYLGRMDRQLKVRGYRVEPGEVESVLRAHPQVVDAAVLGLGEGADARLIAYVIPADPPPLAVELRAHVARHLPDYMAPAAYVTVASWPKTPNGKVDHAALPRPDVLSRDVGTAYAAPSSAAEQRVAAVWRDCLGVAAIGLDDNFFDLGGHSLLLVKVHGRLRDELKAELSLVDLFRLPTVRLQAGALEAGEGGRAQADKAAAVRADQRAAQQNAARMRRRRP